MKYRLVVMFALLAAALSWGQAAIRGDAFVLEDQRVWLAMAHTPNGHVMGTYVIEGSQICLTPHGGQRACSPYEANRNVGESWSQTAADGSTIQVRIDAGR